jgi:hypothetical protein
MRFLFLDANFSSQSTATQGLSLFDDKGILGAFDVVHAPKQQTSVLRELAANGLEF